jgi:hypothetical protein
MVTAGCSRTTHLMADRKQRGKGGDKFEWEEAQKGTSPLTDFLQLGSRACKNSTTSWEPRNQHMSQWGTFQIQTVTEVIPMIGITASNSWVLTYLPVVSMHRVCHLPFQQPCHQPDLGG